jgi:hypothetical protein
LRVRSIAERPQLFSRVTNCAYLRLCHGSPSFHRR